MTYMYNNFAIVIELQFNINRGYLINYKRSLGSAIEALELLNILAERIIRDIVLITLFLYYIQYYAVQLYRY